MINEQLIPQKITVTKYFENVFDADTFLVWINTLDFKRCIKDFYWAKEFKHFSFSYHSNEFLFVLINFTGNY